jgi:hypothetical protein
MLDETVKEAGSAKPASKKAGKKTPKKQKTKSNGNGVRGKEWTFPKNSLEEAVRIPKALDEKFAGNPTPAPDVAKAVGFSQAKDWRFTDLLKSANLYGLVTGTGASATVAVTQLGQDIVAPKASSQRSQALGEAFRKVDDFNKVEAYYGGKRIPEDEFFVNTLTREFAIPKERVDTFATIFLQNQKFLRSFSPIPSTVSPVDGNSITGARAKEAGAVAPPSNEATDNVGEEPRVREFLDTCFVMMPFGEWQDRYYKEIYIQAIKDAGLEPVRGDELYHTGSVVEQIWEQIVKAKLLVADLSGRNPNVFYELGLAHAATKPVVFTAASIDDVPFDLRHLRVIIYDIREPNWGAKLRQNMSDYLRNAMREPGKSIPAPFRKLEETEN